MSRELDRVKKTMNSDEALYWGVIEVIRGLDMDSAMDQAVIAPKDDAVRKGVHTVQQVLRTLQEMGLDFSEIDPGHGIGHIARDYVNALRLFRGLDSDPRHMFIGFCGAVLHDIGCSVIERYSEPSRAVRHAEASAILIAEAVGKIKHMGQITCNQSVWMLIRYAVAAHTHYTREMTVKCSDGVTRAIMPYRDIRRFEPEMPIWFVWFTRWPDRLECCGPAFVGRHYLTLAKPHKDFSAALGKFYDVDFAHSMQPLLRSGDEKRADKVGQTMLEHLAMFSASQTNESPYGKHDFGRMIQLRDEHTEMLNHIIGMVHRDYETEEHIYWDRARNELTQNGELVLEAWRNFLAENIEPTQLGAIAAGDLENKFRELVLQDQSAWLTGFYHTMQGYRIWSRAVLKDLDGIPKEWLELPGICKDAREPILPKSSWVDLLDEVRSS
jgi:hypothetical protein